MNVIPNNPYLLLTIAKMQQFSLVKFKGPERGAWGAETRITENYFGSFFWKMNAENQQAWSRFKNKGEVMHLTTWISRKNITARKNNNFL